MIEVNRVIAIDWSGRAGRAQTRAIWLAEAVDGEIARLECERDRREVVDELIGLAGQDPRFVVGLDFAFSVPEWYVHELGLASAPELWGLLADEALTPSMKDKGLAAWMNTPDSPFWVTSEGHQHVGGAEFRLTDLEARAVGTQPKSVFQLVGPGQVGRGSLFGMQALHALRRAGFLIWPFDEPDTPLVVEIFPRTLTGPVSKGDRAERERYLLETNFPREFLDAAAASEDAFDAAVSALAMAERVYELSALEPCPDYALEGRIWLPQDPPGLRPRQQSFSDVLLADGSPLSVALDNVLVSVQDGLVGTLDREADARPAPMLGRLGRLAGGAAELADLPATGAARLDARDSLLEIAVHSLAGSNAGSIPALPGESSQPQTAESLVALCYWAARERIDEGLELRADGGYWATRVLGDLGGLAEQAWQIELVARGDDAAAREVARTAAKRPDKAVDPLSFAAGALGVGLMRLAGLAMIGAAAQAVE
jgi:hypothetical protein